jgi:hypothetical protein
LVSKASLAAYGKQCKTKRKHKYFEAGSEMRLIFDKEIQA